MQKKIVFKEMSKTAGRIARTELMAAELKLVTGAGGGTCTLCDAYDCVPQ